jgi:hypothetical protein
MSEINARSGSTSDSMPTVDQRPCAMKFDQGFLDLIELAAAGAALASRYATRIPAIEHLEENRRCARIPVRQQRVIRD